MTLFGDMLQLGRLIRETLHNEPHEPQRSCAALYDLYRALDAVIESSRVGLKELGSLHTDSVQTTKSFDSPEEKWAYFTNKAFEKVDESVIELVTALSAAEHALKIFGSEVHLRFDYHLGAKAAWYKEFVRLYDAGRIDVASRKVKRSVLRLAEDDELAILADYQTVDPETLDRLRDVEDLDVAGPAAIARLVEVGEKNVEGLATARDELAAFIRKYCTLDSLLASRPPERWWQEPRK